MIFVEFDRIISQVNTGGVVSITKVLAQCGVSWHTKHMSVMRKGAWRSLGIGLLGAIALSGCGILHPSSSPPPASVANICNPAVDSGLVPSLQKQIRERNKRIAVHGAATSDDTLQKRLADAYISHVVYIGTENVQPTARVVETLND